MSPERSVKDLFGLYKALYGGGGGNQLHVVGEARTVGDGWFATALALRTLDLAKTRKNAWCFPSLITSGFCITCSKELEFNGLLNANHRNRLCLCGFYLTFGGDCVILWHWLVVRKLTDAGTAGNNSTRATVTPYPHHLQGTCW